MYLYIFYPDYKFCFVFHYVSVWIPFIQPKSYSISLSLPVMGNYLSAGCFRTNICIELFIVFLSTTPYNLRHTSFSVLMSVCLGILLLFFSSTSSHLYTIVCPRNFLTQPFPALRIVFNEVLFCILSFLPTPE